MIQELIKEVNKVEQYFWDRVQSDYLFNNYGSFLYKILNYDQLILQIEKKISSEFKQYTINRWYNYACSIVVQHYFSDTF